MPRNTSLTQTYPYASPDHVANLVDVINCLNDQGRLLRVVRDILSKLSLSSDDKHDYIVAVLLEEGGPGLGPLAQERDGDKVFQELLDGNTDILATIK